MNLTISIFLIFISYFPSFYRRKEKSNNFNFNLKKKEGKERFDSRRESSRYRVMCWID